MGAGDKATLQWHPVHGWHHRDRRPGWEKCAHGHAALDVSRGKQSKNWQERSRVQVRAHQGLLNFGITISVKDFLWIPIHSQPFSEDFYVPRSHCGAGIQENKYIRLDEFTVKEARWSITI